MAALPAEHVQSSVQLRRTLQDRLRDPTLSLTVSGNYLKRNYLRVVEHTKHGRDAS